MFKQCLSRMPKSWNTYKMTLTFDFLTSKCTCVFLSPLSILVCYNGFIQRNKLFKFSHHKRSRHTDVQCDLWYFREPASVTLAPNLHKPAKLPKLYFIKPNTNLFFQISIACFSKVMQNQVLAKLTVKLDMIQNCHSTQFLRPYI